MKTNETKILVITLIMLCCGFTASAQEASPTQTENKPVEISAAGSLEWDKNLQSYTAKKDVIVKQGEVKIECDSLTARYNDTKTMSDISTLTASGNVKISSPPYTASGNEAVYDVTNGTAVLTGSTIIVTTDEDVLTAEEKIEFTKSENKLVAYGNPVIKHKLDTIKAKTMTAYFKKDENGKMVSDRMEANGGVKIKTQSETITSKTIIYDNKTRKAVLEGDVKVEKEGNIIQGTKAIVDMNTGISQLLGDGVSQEGNGRVKGVFWPKKK